MLTSTLPGNKARVLFNRIVKTFLCVRIGLSRTFLAFKRPATMSPPCLEPNDERDEDDGDYDCFIPFWRVLNLRDGPT